MRLGVSAVQHDMKREETIEEVEKNTEWQRRTPKRKAVCSNHIGDASALSRKVSHEIFRIFANKKEDQLTNC